VDLDKVHAILQDDRRYMAMASLPDERHEIIAIHVHDLAKKSLEDASRRGKMELVENATEIDKTRI